MCYVFTLSQHMTPTFCIVTSFRCLLFTHMLATLFLSWTITTPEKEPILGPVQARFNKYLSKVRGIIEIEISFGRIRVRRRAIFLRTCHSISCLCLRWLLLAQCSTISTRELRIIGMSLCWSQPGDPDMWQKE